MHAMDTGAIGRCVNRRYDTLSSEKMRSLRDQYGRRARGVVYSYLVGADGKQTADMIG
jgi:hypothetical protein